MPVVARAQYTALPRCHRKKKALFQRALKLTPLDFWASAADNAAESEYKFLLYYLFKNPGIPPKPYCWNDERIIELGVT